ncbi:MAG TPA: chromosome segregation protein SMC, partial [Pseudomonadales bacterium]|nr:chromosome segregation protein SMC [Pseudomonadales bacterium]
MRLKSIKLAGFKSFVDPSTVNLPENLTAIVGPNGCGKSNVIDAVRWVMGESSAKHLRGESMTDVIFNGSATRKPIGQASIELEFDNSDGSLVGELGAFSEIAIKRTVSRDGQSNYYLNGTRCRRKDITDIFLGTGLGPRSYAIIEQGTISRLIEAKPEELRVFIEEAAGISKYKERRRETENRMQRTRENLDRLGDVREELDRQLQHLNRQAQTAERYKNLKEEERLYKAQLQVLRWLTLETNVQQHSADIRTLELKREEQLTEQISIETALEVHHSQAQQFNENFNRVQGEFYSLGADVARLEQQIRHQKQREQDVQRNLADVTRSLEQVSDHLSTDQQQMTHLDEEILSLEPELELLQSTQDETSERLLLAEENMQQWQHDWDQFNAYSSAISQKAQVEQSRIEQLEQAIRRGRDRITRLLEERQGLHDPDLEASVHVLEETLERARDALLEQEDALVTQRQDIEQQRQHNQSLSKSLDQQKTALQGKKGQLTSLEALQEAAMGSSGTVLNQWLKTHALDHAPRLINQITVVPGWEVALETVLSPHLQALCLDKVTQLRDGIGTLLANASFVSAEGINVASFTAAQPSGIAAPRLLDFVQGHAAALQILLGVYAVENLNEAFDLQHQLQASESVVTRDGFWLGPNWLRLQKETNKSAGVLARKQQIEQLKIDIAEQETQLAELTEQLEAGRLRLLEGEARRETLSQELTLANRKIADLKAQLSAKEVRLEQFSLRRQ